MRKFLQAVTMTTWRELRKEAQTRGCSIQELLRVELIPFWLKAQKTKN